MTTAIILSTNSDGTQTEDCRLSIGTDGKITADKPCSSGHFILSRPIDIPTPDGKLARLTPTDGENFLRALPSVYGGTRLRVELQTDSLQKKGLATLNICPPSFPEGNQWQS